MSLATTILTMLVTAWLWRPHILLRLMGWSDTGKSNSSIDWYGSDSYLERWLLFLCRQRGQTFIALRNIWQEWRRPPTTHFQCVNFNYRRRTIHWSDRVYSYSELTGNDDIIKSRIAAEVNVFGKRDRAVVLVSWLRLLAIIPIIGILSNLPVWWYTIRTSI